MRVSERRRSSGNSEVEKGRRKRRKKRVKRVKRVKIVQRVKRKETVKDMATLTSAGKRRTMCCCQSGSDVEVDSGEVGRQRLGETICGQTECRQKDKRQKRPPRKRDREGKWKWAGNGGILMRGGERRGG